MIEHSGREKTGIPRFRVSFFKGVIMRRVTASRQVLAIQDWLTGRVAFYLERSVAEIDPAVALAEFGIDSVSALALCGDVEDEWNLEVDATMVFDYPTVKDIALYLDAELAARVPLAA
jgi:acyl carrier protein